MLNGCRLLLTLTLVSCVGETAFAYRWNRCVGGERLKWNHSPVRFRAHAASFSTVSPFRSALAEAAGAWNESPGNFRYNITFDEPHVGRNNGTNEVWWSAEIEKPAVTKWWIRPAQCEFTEADIIFNSSSAFWVLSGENKGFFWPYGGSLRPFQTAAMHEFGHAQGLKHTPDTYSIMGMDWNHVHANGNVANAYPGEDAIRGSMDTYGRHPSAGEDLGVTHWRWIGTTERGHYSKHARTRVFNASGAEILPFLGEPEPVYIFARASGLTLQVEVGFENLGAHLQSVRARFYLSTDNVISTADASLDTIDLTVGPDAVFWHRQTLTLPSGLATGASRYFVGVIIDYGNAVFEINENNNATYLFQFLSL